MRDSTTEDTKDTEKNASLSCLAFRQVRHPRRRTGMSLLYEQESYQIIGAWLLVNFGHFPKLEYERIVR